MKGGKEGINEGMREREIEVKNGGGREGINEGWRESESEGKKRRREGRDKRRDAGERK